MDEKFWEVFVDWLRQLDDDYLNALIINNQSGPNLSNYEQLWKNTQTYTPIKFTNDKELQEQREKRKTALDLMIQERTRREHWFF